MTVLIDSWSWIEYFIGSEHGEKVKGYVEGEEDAIISTINLAEVYGWILRSYDRDVAEEKREVMKKRCFVVPVDEDIAIRSAKIKHERKWGLGDSIVYATAKIEKAKILTGDLDFKGLRDVIFID